MASHKFRAGDRVRLLSNRANNNVRSGVYTIVRIMPVTSDGCQYRAKNELDHHERVLDEAQLQPI